MTYQDNKQLQAKELYDELENLVQEKCAGLYDTKTIITSQCEGAQLFEYNLKEIKPSVFYDTKYVIWGLRWRFTDDQGHLFGCSIDTKSKYSLTEFVQIYLYGLKQLFNAVHLEIV